MIIESPAPTDDAFAWDVIALVSALLAPVAEAMGGAVLAAFEAVEDALADRRQDEEGPCPTPV